MSADNGIFILSSPTEQGSTEYRVAHAFMSPMSELETHWFDPEDEQKYLISEFGGAVYGDQAEALSRAMILLDRAGCTEYGIQQCSISYPFGTIREEIAPDPLPEWACEHCSYGDTHVGHGDVDEWSTDCKNPDLIYNRLVKHLREKFRGMNEHVVAREVLEVLKEGCND